MTIDQIDTLLTALVALYPDAHSLTLGRVKASPTAPCEWTVTGHVPRLNARRRRVPFQFTLIEGGSPVSPTLAIADWRRNELYHRTGELTATLAETAL